MGIDLNFAETDGPIRFDGVATADAFARVAHGWPAVRSGTSGEPFAHVAARGAQWALRIVRPEPRRRTRDPVNAICDLIVDLNWSRLRHRPELMCLHAAGVQLGDALVVFPSGRRAGKSTLAAELARRGHRVFSDDILAIDTGPDGTVQGLATGIAPRLRLPVPAEATEAFRDWVAADPGPANRQYKYLTGAPVASQGTGLPVGAVVVLDRSGGPGAPALTPLDPDAAVPALIHQNFGRFVHSGRALSAFRAMAGDLPCHRLTYATAAEAADLLEHRLATGQPTARARAHGPGPGVADFSNALLAYDPATAYRRRSGFTAVQSDSTPLVADASGRGIFRLGPGMIPIWHLLDAPIRPDQIVEVLEEVYREVSRDVLVRDVHAALTVLNRAGLIEAVSGQGAQAPGLVGPEGLEPPTKAL